MSAEWVAELERAGVSLARSFPLGRQTTYRVGGCATAMAHLSDEQDIARLQEALGGLEQRPSILVLGKGSNMCVADSGFDGLVVSLGESFTKASIEGTSVRAGGALALPILARRLAALGLGGLEWSVGVPGSVGGGLRMNAGGHGSQMKDVVASAESWELIGTGGRTLRVADGLDLRYRASVIGPDEVVTWVTFELVPCDVDGAQRQIGEIVRWRRDHQPGGANAGSVFVNPEGVSAAKLIEEAGLKGLRHGSASVSEKHANFIQADKDGAAGDVFWLVKFVQDRVCERTGVSLVTEIRFVGDWGD